MNSNPERVAELSPGLSAFLLAGLPWVPVRRRTIPSLSWEERVGRGVPLIFRSPRLTYVIKSIGLLLTVAFQCRA